MTRDRRPSPEEDDQVKERRIGDELFTTSWFQDCIDVITPTIEAEEGHMENLYMIARKIK